MPNDSITENENILVRIKNTIIHIIIGIIICFKVSIFLLYSNIIKKKLKPFFNLLLLNKRMDRFISITLIILICDFLWINFIFIKPFGDMIQNVQNAPMKFNLIPVIYSYFILILFTYFIIPKLNSRYEAFLCGFLVYAIYDSTNYATLNNWNITIASVDSIWGGILFLIVYNVCLLI